MSLLIINVRIEDMYEVLYLSEKLTSKVCLMFKAN